MDKKEVQLEKFYDRYILQEITYPRLKYVLEEYDYNFQVQ